MELMYLKCFSEFLSNVMDGNTALTDQVSLHSSGLSVSEENVTVHHKDSLIINRACCYTVRMEVKQSQKEQQSSMAGRGSWCSEYEDFLAGGIQFHRFPTLDKR